MELELERLKDVRSVEIIDFHMSSNLQFGPNNQLGYSILMNRLKMQLMA